MEAQQYSKGIGKMVRCMARVDLQTEMGTTLEIFSLIKDKVLESIDLEVATTMRVSG